MEPGLKRHIARTILNGHNGLLEKSPESTLTVEKLLEIDNKPPAPDTSEIKVSTIVVCCGCMCKSYGVACDCVGQGCYLGMKGHFEMTNNRIKYALQPLRVDRSAPTPPVTLPVRRFIKFESHDFREYLKTQLYPLHRAATCSFNEKYAMWVYGQTMPPNAINPFHFLFRNSVVEVESGVAFVFGDISTHFDEQDVIDRNDRQTIMLGAIRVHLRRQAEQREEQERQREQQQEDKGHEE